MIFRIDFLHLQDRVDGTIYDIDLDLRLGNGRLAEIVEAVDEMFDLWSFREVERSFDELCSLVAEMCAIAEALRWPKK